MIPSHCFLIISKLIYKQSFISLLITTTLYLNTILTYEKLTVYFRCSYKNLNFYPITFHHENHKTKVHIGTSHPGYVIDATVVMTS